MGGRRGRGGLILPEEGSVTPWACDYSFCSFFLTKEKGLRLGKRAPGREFPDGPGVEDDPHLHFL